MVKMYPYTLKVFQEAESVFDQSTGDYVTGESEWVDFGKCRDEINGSGSRIATEDSENYIFSAVIYAPKEIPTINKGVKIQVWDGSTKRLEGNVIRFGKEQMHTRIWL